MKSQNCIATIAISVFSLLLCIGAGCQQKTGIEITPKFTRATHPVDAADAHILSQENYESITDGMTQDQVRAIFGTTMPTVPSPGGNEEYELVWEKDGKQIVVRFRGGTSIGKSQTGIMEETD